jgi:hypothetical protein
VIAHVGGVPVEEVLPVLMSGAGAWLLLWLTSLGARLRATRTHRETDRHRSTNEWRGS